MNRETKEGKLFPIHKEGTLKKSEEEFVRNSNGGHVPFGDKLWKLPEDDDIDVDDVFVCPIIPGTSGIET